MNIEENKSKNFDQKIALFNNTTKRYMGDTLIDGNVFKHCTVTVFVGDLAVDGDVYDNCKVSSPEGNLTINGGVGFNAQTDAGYDLIIGGNVLGEGRHVADRMAIIGGYVFNNSSVRAEVVLMTGKSYATSMLNAKKDIRERGSEFYTLISRNERRRKRNCV